MTILQKPSVEPRNHEESPALFSPECLAKIDAYSSGIVSYKDRIKCTRLAIFETKNATSVTIRNLVCHDQRSPSILLTTDFKFLRTKSTIMYAASASANTLNAMENPV